MAERLAIKGGSPLVPKEKLMPWPQISDIDREKVKEVLDSGVLAGAYAPQVQNLQDEFSHYLRAEYCIGVNSGTAALHMAVAAAGIGPGDEVITSAFSFLASATAPMHQGAIPVFVDIDPKTYNIDPRLIEDKINEHTRAIIIVHIHGLPANIEEIKDIAQKHNLVLIEDAAQAPGATYHGQKIGTWGDIAAFSLNQSKNFQAGEGGLLVTNDREYWLRADMVRMFGEQVKEQERRTYVAQTLGWNYRMPELTAAIARAQLTKLDKINENAQRNADILNSALESTKGISPPEHPKDRTHVYHKYRARLEPKHLDIEISPRVFRDKVLLALQAEGVPAVLWQTFPLPANPLFQRKEGFGKGFPWSFPGVRSIEYHTEDYPETIKLLDSSLVIGSEKYPLYAQPSETVELWARAIYKVFAEIEEVITAVELPKEEAFALGEIRELK